MTLTLIDNQEAHYPPISQFRYEAPTPPGLGQSAWRLHQASYAWSAVVGDDPTVRSGARRPTTIRERWRVGIVQNVLREQIDIEYHSGLSFHERWDDAVVDYYDVASAPFILGPATQTIYFAPLDREFTFEVTAVRDLWYDPDGSLTPADDTHGGVRSLGTARGYEIEFADHPWTPILNQRGSTTLARAVHALAMQFWVVAKPVRTGEPVVIAHSPPFTLIAAMEVAAPPPGRPAPIIPPTPGWVGRSRSGIHIPRVGSDVASLRGPSSGDALAAARGPGRRRPVLTGTSAIDRAEQWLRANHLAPRP